MMFPSFISKLQTNKEHCTGLVDMRDDSCLRGHGIESQHHTLNGHDIFSHWSVLKVVMFVWKNENKRKNDGVGQLKKTH